MPKRKGKTEIRLDRIYTRGGDHGMTSLGSGLRVPKTHPRIAAFGMVDELNAVLGITVAQAGLTAADRKLLRRIQNDLFDLGADLCVPRDSTEKPGDRLRITAEHVLELEQAIDNRTTQLEPLRSFVLPGGTPASSWLHLSRVVCRRAELEVVALTGAVPSEGDQALIYLNRLSDLLFVMGRWANDRGRADVLWVPGGERSQAAPKRPTATRTKPQPAVISRRRRAHRGSA